MNFDVIEYGEIDLAPDQRQAQSAPRPWAWAVVGAILGTLLGYLSAADLTVPATVASQTPPLTLPTAEAEVANPDRGPVAPRSLIPGFSQTLWVLVDTDNPRLLRWSPHEPRPSTDARSVSTVSVRPDASGLAQAEQIDLATGTMLVVTRSQGDYTRDHTVALSLQVSGWAWHPTEALRIAWSESDGDGTVVRWTSFGPTVGEVRLEGDWHVVAYSDRVIVQSGQSLGLIDPEGTEFFVERVVETSPLAVQGIFGGLVYGVHGPDRTMIAVEMLLGNEDRVDWRHPDAVAILEAPGSGWGALWFGKSVEIHGPDDTVLTHLASGEPHWSQDGQFLVFPDGSDVVVFSTLSQEFVELPTGHQVLAAWGS